MSNFTKIRQHFTTTAVIGGACLLIFIVSLSALYRHSYQSSIPEPWMEPSYSSRSSHHKGPAGLVDRLLILLPKDRATKSDYGFHEDWLEKAIDNRKRYADFHGYSFMWANLETYPEFKIHPQWSKIAGLNDAFNKHPEVEWIWCLDSDAIIMNATIGLWDYLLSPEALMREVKSEGPIWFGGKKQLPQHELELKTPTIVDPNNIYLIISNDSNGLNTGSFFVRRNAFMSAFVDLWRDPYLIKNKFTFNEQDGLAHLILTHPHVRKHVGIVEQSKINIYPGHFQQHDFLVHFAGCRNSGQDCDKLAVDFWNRRTVVNTDTLPRKV